MGFRSLKGRKIYSPTSDPSQSAVDGISGHGACEGNDITDYSTVGNTSGSIVYSTNFDFSNSTLERRASEFTVCSTAETLVGGLVYSTDFDSSDSDLDKSSSDIADVSTEEKTTGGLIYSNNFDSPESDLEKHPSPATVEIKENTDWSTLQTTTRGSTCSTSVGSTSFDSAGSREELRKFIRTHQCDPNYPSKVLERARSLLLDNHLDKLDIKQAQQLCTGIEVDHELHFNDSVYPEVRALISPTDDPNTLVNTFRLWFLGTITIILGTGINEFFGTRSPGAFVTAYVTQLITFPCGLAMARYLPTRHFGKGRWSWTLNPGPFSQKEHILLGVMSNVAFSNGTMSVTPLFTVLKLNRFFGERVLVSSAAFRILLAFSTQLLGYGLAGFARRIVVHPPSMIWPSSLGQIALNKAIHNDNGQLYVTGWKISRRRFLTLCCTGMFFYFWLPGYLFQALSSFNWTTWIAPQNVALALVTGSFCGLGLNPWPTFDWNVVSSIIDPIITPFFATVNFTVGAAITACVVLPLFYWKNISNTAYFPLNSSDAFNKFGTIYNVSMVLNPDHTLNATAYESYGAPFIGAGLGISYAAEFAAIPALCCHILLHNWVEVKNGIVGQFKWKSPLKFYDNDVHNRLMMAYPEVPDWWFGLILTSSFIMGCIICLCYPAGFPVWALVLAMILTLIIQVVVGVMAAITNVWWNANVLAECIIGYLLPGRPFANMLFKSYVTQCTHQANTCCQDLKLGIYMKIPPRVMFAAQLYAVILGCLVSVGVNAWQVINIKDFCSPDQGSHFICEGEHSYFSEAILWGVIGSKRLLSSGGFNRILPWCAVFGAVLPIPFWFLARKFPNSQLRYIFTPTMLASITFIPLHNLISVWPACIFGFIFNFWVRRRNLDWWQKYAYVLTSAFKVGITLSTIVIFFAVQLHDTPINWWGNSISFSGVDGGSMNAPLCVLKVLANGEKLPDT